MKKLFLIVCIAACCALQAAAQRPTFTKHNNLLSASVGIGGFIYDNPDDPALKRIPVMQLSYEFCVAERLFDWQSSLGIGVTAGYTSAKWDGHYLLASIPGFDDSYGWKSNNFILGIKGVLHYAFADNLDTYTGLRLGYNIVSSKATGLAEQIDRLGEEMPESSFIIGWNVGARYYFTPSFALFVEAGYDISYLSLGATIKL